MEGFDWQFNPKAFDRVQIEELASGDFIRRCNNLIMVGWSGIGKSHIIQALGQKVCAQAAHLLYKIIASRNQKRSTALVANVDFDKWAEYLVDGPLAMALLDRLVERAINPQDQRQDLPHPSGQNRGQSGLREEAVSFFPISAPTGGQSVTPHLAPCRPPNWYPFSFSPPPTEITGWRRYLLLRILVAPPFGDADAVVAMSTSARSKSQLVQDMPDQPGEEHYEECRAKAPIGDSVERVEIGWLQVSPPE